VGLIINELVSNAGKHAYPDRPSGTIWVRVLLQSDKQTILISVRDEGVGFPAGYDSTTSRRLGTRLVNALSKQLGGELMLPTSSLGTNFTLLIPLGLPRPHDAALSDSLMADIPAAAFLMSVRDLLASSAALQRYVGSWSTSRHGADIVNVSSLTLSGSGLAKFTALR
jgi:hypothetical protein